MVVKAQQKLFHRVARRNNPMNPQETTDRDSVESCALADALGPAWREVSKDDFFKAIGSQNVMPKIIADRWPYSSDYVTPTRAVIGKSVGYLPEGSALAAKRYYLPNTRRSNPQEEIKDEGERQ